MHCCATDIDEVFNMANHDDMAHEERSSALRAWLQLAARPLPCRCCVFLAVGLCVALLPLMAGWSMVAWCQTSRRQRHSGRRKGRLQKMRLRRRWDEYRAWNAMQNCVCRTWLSWSVLADARPEGARGAVLGGGVALSKRAHTSSELAFRCGDSRA